MSTVCRTKSSHKLGERRMEIQQAIKTFSSYETEEKVAFLARLAFELTILARDTYEVGQESVRDAPRLRRINEVQHTLTSSLHAFIKGDPKRLPDDVLIRVVLEHPGDKVLQ